MSVLKDWPAPTTPTELLRLAGFVRTAVMAVGCVNDSYNFAPWLRKLWEGVYRVAGDGPPLPYRPGPHDLDHALAEVDRVVDWCHTRFAPVQAGGGVGAGGRAGNEPGATAKKPKVPQEETNRRVREYLEKHGEDDMMRITVVAIHKATGCSIGAIHKAPLWKALAKRKALRGETKTASRERSRPLSGKMMAVVPDPRASDPADEAAQREIAALISSQKRDEMEDAGSSPGRRRSRGRS